MQKTKLTTNKKLQT